MKKRDIDKNSCQCQETENIDFFMILPFRDQVDSEPWFSAEARDGIAAILVHIKTRMNTEFVKDFGEVL